MEQLYFAQSSIYLKKKKFKNAKLSLIKGLEIKPKKVSAIFQLGNIFLMEKNYKDALKQFDKAININKEFWQAMNNKGLIYFETNNRSLAIVSFKKAIQIEENSEPMLALAVTLQDSQPKESILLAKKALQTNPNYVSAQYRKEQLWGSKIQKATEKLFKLEELKKDIKKAKLNKN